VHGCKIKANAELCVIREKSVLIPVNREFPILIPVNRARHPPPFRPSVKRSLQTRRGENPEMGLKLLTIVDSSATYTPSLWILFGHYMQTFLCF